jgi:hypothetical protein
LPTRDKSTLSPKFFGAADIRDGISRTQCSDLLDRKPTTIGFLPQTALASRPRTAI